MRHLSRRMTALLAVAALSVFAAGCQGEEGIGEDGGIGEENGGIVEEEEGLDE